MEHNDIGMWTALVAGFVSFISPCVLPLVPAYLAFMSGVSIKDMKTGDGGRRVLGRVFLTSIFFVTGFSLVFIALGASASAIGQALTVAMPVITRVLGVVVIILGIHMTGIFRIKFLVMEKRFQSSGGAGLVSAFVMGLAFAFGWTPCIGPFLAYILTLAAQQESITRGVFLLTAYSLGLGIPFILAGLFINVFVSLFAKVQKHYRAIEIGSGVLLIIFGLVLVFGYMTLLSGYFNQWFGGLEVG